MVITEEKYFKPNMDADILDPDQCYIRAKLSIVAKDTVTYIVDGIN